jgi:hypothetical protein
MILGLDRKMLQTFNHDRSNGKPQVNHLDGPHSKLFLVIPIRAWDDAQSSSQCWRGNLGFAMGGKRLRYARKRPVAGLWSTPNPLTNLQKRPTTLARIIFEPSLKCFFALGSGLYSRFVERIYLSMVFRYKPNMHRLGIGFPSLSQKKAL